MVDFWYRFEWQEHDSVHIHGFLWLKESPNPEGIDCSLLDDHDRVIPEDQEEKMRQFVSFWGGIITATNPFPRVDENTPLMGQHPCRLRNDTLRDTKEELVELLNWIEISQTWLLQVKRKVPEHNERQTFCPSRFACGRIICNLSHTIRYMLYVFTTTFPGNISKGTEYGAAGRAVRVSKRKKKMTTADTRESLIRTVQ